MILQTPLTLSCTFLENPQKQLKVAQPKGIWPLGPAKKHSYSKGITGAGPLHTFDPKQRVGTPQLPPGISPHGTRQSPHLPPGLTEAAGSFSALLRQLQTASDHMEKVPFLFGGLFFFPPSIFGKAETPPQAWP